MLSMLLHKTCMLRPFAIVTPSFFTHFPSLNVDPVILIFLRATSLSATCTSSLSPARSAPPVPLMEPAALSHRSSSLKEKRSICEMI